jgi:hypothetical protein
MKLLAALAAATLLAWIFFASRSLFKLRRSLDEMEGRLARRFATLQGRVREIDTVVRDLDFDRRRAGGEIHFEASMKVGDALSVHPRVQEIFTAFGLSGGGCSGGGVAETATIAEACAGSSLDPREVVAALDRFLEDPKGPIRASAGGAKLHQIRARLDPRS